MAKYDVYDTAEPGELPMRIHARTHEAAALAAADQGHFIHTPHVSVALVVDVDTKQDRRVGLTKRWELA